jgi:glycosyltransferase involved in cell wall biosynthesis
MEEITAVTDIFLLTSEYESFGLSALEAMAAKAIVISTNAGGIPEINIDGKTGFMANVGDVETMSNKAIAVLQNENLLQEMKENAYEHAKKFDIKNIIPIYEKLYSRFCRMSL